MTDEGTLGILNVGAGDLRIELGDDQPEERLATAAKMVDDLFRAGYSILIEMSDGTTRRATAFDRDARAYVISEPGKPIEPPTLESTSPTTSPKRRGRPRKTLVPAATSRATAIAPSAGG